MAPVAVDLRAPGATAPLRALGAGVPKGDWLDSPVGAFLVTHPSAGPILIDTGVHQSVSADRSGTSVDSTAWPSAP